MIVGIGEALWDVLPEGKKLGGAPANFAYHVSQFGLPGMVVSAVGDDALGRELVDNLAAKEVDMLMATVPFPTGTVQVSLDADGIPQYDIKEGVAWDNIPFLPEVEALARRTRVLCFGSLAQRSDVSRQTINRFIDAMPVGDDTLIVFDVNLRQHFYSADVLRHSMMRCNILKINDEELVIVGRMFGYDDLGFEEQCRSMLSEFGLKILILTCGVNGSYVFTADDVSYRPTPVVEVVDTVGAGDSFTASFVASLIKGKGIAAAHDTAVSTSAYVCASEGAMPLLPATITEA